MVKLSDEGKILADKARKQAGFTNKQKLYKDKGDGLPNGLSLGTVKRFWRQESISIDSFIIICKAIKIDDWCSLIDWENDTKKWKKAELKDELNHLKDVERPKASNAIAEARDKGDLSENAEYDAAKEAQGMLEMRISKLEETLSNARVIDESQLDNSKVLVLSKVKIKNQVNGMVMDYMIVADGEADLSKGKISVNSPIGKGLLGKAVGEVAQIKVPSGVINFEIVEITR